MARIELLYIASHGTLNILRLSDLITREGSVVDSVRAARWLAYLLPGLSTIITAVLLTFNKKLKSGSHCLSSPIVGTTIIMLVGD